MYSTLALGKETEIVKVETALRKEKEAVCCYVHVRICNVAALALFYFPQVFVVMKRLMNLISFDVIEPQHYGSHCVYKAG